MTVRRVFWLLLLLAIVGAFNYRRLVFDTVNFGYKFSKLYCTKEFVAELRVRNDAILVYAEPVKGKSLKIAGLEKLQPTIKRAYQDYFTFIKNYYPEILIDHPKIDLGNKNLEKLTIIFVSPSTYESLSQIRKQDSAGYIGFFNTIYLKTYGSSYDIDGLRMIICHEIFHYLNNSYGLTSEFEETAARRFGSLN